jgi:hypothetical protein
MSDLDDPRHDDARAEDAEERYYERQRRRLTRCLCGYPDLPGSCPGPAACPMHGEDLEGRDDGQ